MLDQLKNTVKQQIAEGRESDAIRTLLSGLREDSGHCKGLFLLQAEAGDLKKNERADLLAPDEAARRRARIRHALLGTLDDLTEDDLTGSGSSTPSPTSVLHDWHRYTCDRMAQNNTFQKQLRERLDNKTHFFYLYGLDRHSHHGLVQRFSYDLEGLLKSHLNPKLTARCRVDRADIISLSLNYDLEEYKTDILTSLFTEFSLDPDAHGPLLTRRLDYLYQNSPRLQSLCADDRVCCYMVIPDFDWDKDITPAVVRWFIDDFCGEALPEAAPAFFFFFGIEFGEEDSEVKAEVEAAIRAGKRVQLLPELNMVEKRDIQRWFSVYRKFIPEAGRREEYRRKYFGEAEQTYMEDVEIHLQRIIDELNR